MPGNCVANAAPRPMLVKMTSSTPSAPTKRPIRYCALLIGDVKKKLCVRCSKSCCTARPMIAAITVTPKMPSTAIVCASANGELTATLPLPKEILASLNSPPAAAIQSVAIAKKTMK